MATLVVVITGLVVGHDIFNGRWDMAAWSLAVIWACAEAGLALARYEDRPR